MASLLAAGRQNPAAARGLHARAESVRLRAAPLPRLKCALWQSNPPLAARPQVYEDATVSPFKHKATVKSLKRQVSNLLV